MSSRSMVSNAPSGVPSLQVGDTDAAYGNAEGKRVDRKGFDGDGGVDGLRELAFHDAAQHRGRQGNGKEAVHRAQRRPIRKRQARQPLAERRPRVPGLLLLGLCGNGRKRRFLTARRFLRRLRCLEAMRVSCVG